jgi:DNA-binding NtrC family response regulator
MLRVVIIGDYAIGEPLVSALANAASIQRARDVLEGVTRLRALPTDVVFVDVEKETDQDALMPLQTLKGEFPYLPVIVYTDSPSLADAVRAIKLGASDYMALPAQTDEVRRAVKCAADERRDPSAAMSNVQAYRPPHDIVAKSPVMRAVLDWIARIGNKDIPVLLTGETGTGKELVARAVHATSDRRARPFVPLNCGAIPADLFEAEMFGFGKGAFSGAVRDKPGLVEVAHCGSLFLDEIGELPLGLQVRLLRFLECGEVRRLGETKTVHVDVRVIAATNRSLRDEVNLGRFRADLYFRLNVAKCHIPPLRERLDDLDALAEHWLPRLAQRLAPGVRGINHSALSLLRCYAWPGNARELRNVLEQALTLASGPMLTVGDVTSALESTALAAISGPVVSEHGQERDRLLEALERHHWKLRRTAATLGISRSTLWRRLRQHRISKD